MLLWIVSREVKNASSFFYHQVPVESSGKLYICNVRRPVSGDRRMLVMEMEVGKPTQTAKLLLIF